MGEKLVKGETEQQLRLGQLRMIVFIMVLLFVIILSYTIFWTIDYNNKYAFFIKTDATVVSQVEEDGKVKDILAYTVDGIEYRTTCGYASKNNIGDIVTIYYDKNNPIGIIFALDSKRIIFPVITGLFGVTCIGLIVVYILIDKSIKRKTLSKSGENQITEPDSPIMEVDDNNN